MRLLWGLAVTCEGRGENDRVDEVLSGLLALAPDDGEALRQRGYARARRGRAAEAAADLRHYLDIVRVECPARREVRQLLAELDA